MKATIEKVAEDSTRVRECYGLSGSHDLVIKVQTEDLNDLSVFVYDLWNYGIYQTTTYIVKEKFYKLINDGTKKAAFLFVRAMPYRRKDIIETIGDYEYVDEVSAVFGDQDIIVEVNEKARSDIYNLVVEKIRLLPDINSSETLFTIHP